MKKVGHAQSRVVSAGRNPAAASRPVSVEELAARLIDAFISMRAEEIALGLQEVSGQARGAISVEERQRGGEGRRGHAILDRLHDGAPPGILVADQRLAEEIDRKSQKKRKKGK